MVVFADGAEKVLQHKPFSALDSPHPEDLWQVLAALMSNGAPFDADYARTRAHFERLLEVTQVKGDSETHPFLSPDDEFADFERWDRSNIGMIEPHRDQWFKGEYAREALKTGLKLQAATGINPFQFGMIGSSDQHNSLPDVAEDSFSGKFTVPGRGPDRWSFTVGPETLLPQVYYEWELAAAGYAGVTTERRRRDAERRRARFDYSHACEYARRQQDSRLLARSRLRARRAGLLLRARFGNCHAALDDPRAGPASHERPAAGPAAHDSGASLYVTDLDTPRGALMGHAARPPRRVVKPLRYVAKPSRHAVKLLCHAARSRSTQKPPNRTTV